MIWAPEETSQQSDQYGTMQRIRESKSSFTIVRDGEILVSVDEALVLHRIVLRLRIHIFADHAPDRELVCQQKRSKVKRVRSTKRLNSPMYIWYQ
jgi:hypothetical protein